MKNKKGFTLIELLISISIILILMNASFTTYKGYSNAINKMDVDFFSNSIVNFINNSKQYCRVNNSSAYINFDVINGRIYFVVNTKIIKRLYVPKGFKLNTVNTALVNNRISIDNRGITSDACTINYKDRTGGQHNITISVGTAYVDIKN